MALDTRRKDILESAGKFVSQAFARGSHAVAERADHYAILARDIGELLADRGEPQGAELFTALSARASDLSTYFEAADGARLWHDARKITREQTWLVGGIGAVAGLALARAIRASGQKRSSWALGEHVGEL